ncbi:MAG: preprotein translocase subunit SecE [Dehalococcoidales bacterium]|nr:preprotein translocase subunit SecE [Dehalococcoidales bacterium]
MTQPSVQKKRGFFLFRYFSEIFNELKKVVWLSRREVAYLTGMVLIVVIITGIVLGGLDYGFTTLVNRFFVGG